MHIKEISFYGDGVFKKCSQQSIERFLEDLGGCSHIETMKFHYADLTEIICKLSPAMKNSSIAHFQIEDSYLGTGKSQLFNVFRDMKSLLELWIDCDDGYDSTDLNDDAMAGCIPSLATCTAMQYLTLKNLGFGISSCAALSASFLQMTSLEKLNLERNSINDDFVEALIRGLVECKHLRRLFLGFNMISDDGLDVLIRELPASVCILDLEFNEVTLARQLWMLRFEFMNLEGNQLSRGAAQIIAASLVHPECLLEKLILYGITFGNDGAATLADSLRCNRRLTTMWFELSEITDTGGNAFLPVLCDTGSINSTHNSNHTLRNLGCGKFPRYVYELLELNSSEDESHVAATKILLAHHHLDMRPLFKEELDLLPYVVAWLERFAESRLDLKLSTIFAFLRAMPMSINTGSRVARKTKRKQRRLDS